MSWKRNTITKLINDVTPTFIGKMVFYSHLTFNKTNQKARENMPEKIYDSYEINIKLKPQNKLLIVKRNLLLQPDQSADTKENGDHICKGQSSG